MLNFHQLWLFKKVVEHRGFTAAAAALHISQPSISIQVKQLEKDMGIDLFERCGKRLQLTQAGEEFYGYACRIFDLSQEAEQTLRNLKGLAGAKIRIGASTTPGVYLLPSLVTRFRRQYPGVETDLQIANTRVIEEKLLDNSIDLAVLGEESSYDDNLKIIPLLKDRMVLVCGKDHDLAGMEKVTLSKLARQKFVLREKGSSTRDIADKMLNNIGVTVKEIWELPSTESIKQVLMSGWGVSILSYYSVRMEVSYGCLTVVPLETGFSVSRNINLAWHRLKKFSPATKIFYDYLINTFSEKSNKNTI